MNYEIHRAALRATAKLAFSAAFFGCGGSTTPEQTTGAAQPAPAASNPGSGTGTGSTGGNSTGSSGGTDAGNPVADSGSVDSGSVDSSPAGCDALLTTTFPTPTDYPGVKKTVSNAVVACCEDMLKKSDGFTNPVSHPELRWDCCANLPASDMTDNAISMACTPWGPPVPPRMRLEVV